MNSWAQGEGQPGLGYIFWSEDQGGWGGPIAKNLGPEKTAAAMGQIGMGQGDAAFFVAGDPKTFAKFAGTARTKVGADLGLIDENRFEFVWIVDFPMFEMNEETNHVDFSHNPFSMPQGELEALNAQNPLDVLAYQYDIVCNGYELCSGAVRNHLPEIMLRAFEIAGYGPNVVEEQFGAHAERLPPRRAAARGPGARHRPHRHAAGRRDGHPRSHRLPAEQQGQDLMMNAPSEVSDKQLKELSIRLAPSIKV